MACPLHHYLGCTPLVLLPTRRELLPSVSEYQYPSDHTLSSGVLGVAYPGARDHASWGDGLSPRGHDRDRFGSGHASLEERDSGDLSARLAALSDFKSFMQSLSHTSGEHSMEDFTRGAATAITHIFPMVSPWAGLEEQGGVVGDDKAGAGRVRGRVCAVSSHPCLAARSAPRAGPVAWLVPICQDVCLPPIARVR